MIKEIRDNPPYWPLIKVFFPNINKESTVIVFGDKIYSKYEMPPDLLEHEITHCKQQRYNVLGGIIWWIRYILSTNFRYRMELEAYRNQYRYAQKNYSRDKAWRVLQRIAKDFSGPLYNNIISFEEAIKEITK